MRVAIAIGLLVAGSSPLAAQSIGKSPGQKIGNWEIETIKDNFTDNTRGIAHTPIGKDDTIVIKCDAPGPGSLYISFFTSAFLGDDSIGSSYEYHNAKYRLDDQGVSDMPNPFYDSKTATIVGKPVQKFLSLLSTSDPKRFRAQFTTFDSDLVTMDVDTTGIASAIKATAQICGDTDFSE